MPSARVFRVAATKRNQLPAPVAIIQFNAWRHDKVDSLWAAFGVEFAQQLRKSLPPHQQLFGYLKLCFERYRKIAGLYDLLRASFLWLIYAACGASLVVLIFVHGSKWFTDEAWRVWSYIGSIVAVLGLFAVTFGKVKDAIGNPLSIDLKKYIEVPDYQGFLEFIDAFHKDISKIISAYGRGKIFVFVDDLDRCEIPKAADLIQGLNLMISDNPRLVFIIGMDREKVAAALASKYKDLLPYITANAAVLSNGQMAEPFVGIEFGFSFIEKFIQIPFRVPQPKNEIKDFLAKLANPKLQPATDELPRSEVEIEKIRIVMREDDSPVVGQIGETVAPALDYNPRRLKQFLNLFRLKTIIAGNTGLFLGQNALTLQQIAKWVVILLRWPLLLNDLEESPELLWELERKAVGLEPSLGNSRRVGLLKLVERWQQRPELMKFMQVGVLAGKDYNDQSGWSVARVDVSKLLQVSPLFKRQNPYRPPGQEGGSDANEPQLA